MVPALLESGEVLGVGMYMKGRSHVVSQGAREQKGVHLALLSHPSHENQIEFPENYPNISSKPRTPSTGPYLLQKTTSPSIALLWTLVSRDSHSVADRELPQRGGYPSKDQQQHTRAKHLAFRSTHPQWTRKMLQRVKALRAKPEDLSSMPGAPV